MSWTYGQLGPADVVATIQSDYTASYCVVAALAVVVYDHLSTWAREYEFIWGRKFSSVTLLFHLNRWSIFAWALINLVYEFDPFFAATRFVIIVHSSMRQLSGRMTRMRSCRDMYWLIEVVNFVLYLLWAAFSAIRVHALTGGDRWSSGVVCLLNLVPIGANAFTTFYARIIGILIVPRIATPCASALRVSAAFDYRLTIATRVCMIAADVIVVSITVLRTYSVQREATRNGLETPLVTLLLRNGVLYFLALLGLNLLNIIGQTIIPFSYVVDFIQPLSSIIISHFLLELRQTTEDQQGREDNAWQYSTHSTTGETSHSVSLRFASFVGDMGESLGHDSNSAYHEACAVETSVPDPQESPGPYLSEIVEVDGAAQGFDAA